MKPTRFHQGGLAAVAAVMLAVNSPVWAAHEGNLIQKTTANNYTLTAKAGNISTADGNSVYFWGYAAGTSGPQYPGTTMVVAQGDVVTVTLNNELPIPVSLLFPGQEGVVATGGTKGMLTREAAPGAPGAPTGPVTYTFTASKPGTFLYHSGSRQDLAIEMGLVGALIVRPTGFDPANTATWSAYGSYAAQNPAFRDSAFGSEFLFLLTEMDETIHKQVEQQVKAGVPVDVDMTKWWPVYWFINGRTAPDTLLAGGDKTPWLPNQPYNCAPTCHPGEKVLMRVIGAGRDAHPFHHHGNHAKIIARDGNLLKSNPAGANAAIDLAQSVFTMPVSPGGTMDGIWVWTGENLGFDVYGHTLADIDVDNAPTGNFPGPEDTDLNRNGILETGPLASLQPYEDVNDHLKPLPTKLPLDQDLTFGQMYGGSPFLGSVGVLPPGEGGFNPNNGFSYMWHSHNEKEIINNDIFPGGMLTMMLVEAWTVAPTP